MQAPRSQQGWMLLVGAVLLASTIVTAALAAVLTSLLFPGGFLIDGPAPGTPSSISGTMPPAIATTLPRRDPTTTGTTASPAAESPDAGISGFGWRASVSCSVSLEDIDEVEKGR